MSDRLERIERDWGAAWGSFHLAADDVDWLIAAARKLAEVEAYRDRLVELTPEVLDELERIIDEMWIEPELWNEFSLKLIAAARKLAEVEEKYETVLDGYKELRSRLASITEAYRAYEECREPWGLAGIPAMREALRRIGEVVDG